MSLTLTCRFDAELNAQSAYALEKAQDVLQAAIEREVLPLSR